MYILPPEIIAIIIGYVDTDYSTVLRLVCRLFNDLSPKPSRKKLTTVAARNGHLKLLQWAREHGCPWNEWTCWKAAEGGHLEVLQWAREHHCPWDEWTCWKAAEGGHLEVLQWAREHHCPWNEWTCRKAAEEGHLEVLQWARENGCPK